MDERPVRFGFVLARDFTLSAFSLFLDHVRLAADEGDRSRQLGARWSIFTSNGREERSSCGVYVAPTARFTDPGEFDYLVVVGGLLDGSEPLGPAACDYLKEAAARGVTLIGLCTGTFILCRLGLMRNRRCCVSWYHHADFLVEFPDYTVVADRVFVDDGDRITCAGGTGTADLAHSLITRHLGASVAQKAGQVLMLDQLRGSNDSQPHPPLGIEGSGKVARALLLMEQNIAEPLSIEQIADRVHLSRRQLERAFQKMLGKTPAVAYRDIRLRFAHWLTTQTSRSLTRIAQDAGFADTAHFSRTFRARYGVSPSAARTSGHTDPDHLMAASRIY